MSILIVEDDPVSRKIVELNLKKHGYETLTAKTGREAMDCLSGTLGITLIISDIMMPVMDGLALLQKVKENDDLRHIPVIMCSSLKGLHTVQKAVTLGCDDYLAKPVNAGQLLQKVREILDDEIPVLQRKTQTLLRLNMDSEAYDRIARDSLILMDSVIRSLSEALKEQKPLSDPDQLVDLMSAVSVLGAERVKRLLDRLMDEERRVQNQYLLEYKFLIRDLLELRKSLLDTVPGILHTV